MFDIITFGAAAKDITIKSKNFIALRHKEKFAPSLDFCFPLGSKISIDEIHFNIGGGGANTATTFSLQGFQTAFVGLVGGDLAGHEIIDELGKSGVDIRFIAKNNQKPTSHSIIILDDTGDRTIFYYSGASAMLDEKNILWEQLKTKWIYIAPLSGNSLKVLKDVVNFAAKKRIKIAVNPGYKQLDLPKQEWGKIFEKIDILILNQEEASFLTKVPFDEEKEIFEKLDQMCLGIVVMTKGKEGVVVSDNKYIYSAKPWPGRKIVDTTGAGDAFGSGFVAEFMRGGDIEKSIQLGMANAMGNLSQIGAKTGLLKREQKFKKVDVFKRPIQ